MQFYILHKKIVLKTLTLTIIDHLPHDPEPEEAEVEFAGLEVLLPECLAGGDQVYPIIPMLALLEWVCPKARLQQRRSS